MAKSRVKIVGMDDAYRRVAARCYGVFDDGFSFAVPGWDSNRVILVKKTDIPEDVRATIQNLSYVTVEATNQCQDFTKCKFRNWEINK